MWSPGGLEDYVKFYELSCQVEFNDALKDKFQCGLYEHLAYLMPDNISLWTVPTVPTTPECLHSPSIVSGVIHAMPVQPEPVHVMPARSVTVHIMSTKPESLHIMLAKPEFVHVKPAKQEAVHVMPATLEPLFVMLATPESTAIIDTSPEPPYTSVQITLEPLVLTVGEFMFSSQVAKPCHAKSLFVLCLCLSQ